MEETMIKNLEEKTGRKFSEWIRIAQSSGEKRHGSLIKFLKEKHGLTHGYANLVAHRSNRSDAGSVVKAGGDPVRDQYAGKEGLYPLYEKIMEAVKAFGKDLEIAPKKTYVSLRRKKQFAMIQPSTRTRLDIGLSLKGVSATAILEPSGSFSAMCSHRVRVETEEAISRDLLKWLRWAYDQAG